MNNDLQFFDHEEFGLVRTVEINGVPYFAGIDVAKILEYSRPRDAISDHCKGAPTYRIPTNSGVQEMKVISEGDVYRLIAKASEQNRSLKIKEKAQKFEKWIYDEILPTIRKTGGYLNDVDAMVNTYFNTLDDNYKVIVKGFLTQIQNQQKTIVEQSKVIQDQNPMVKFTEKLLKSKDSILVRQFSKIMQDENVTNFGEKKMYAWLREKRYINNKNEPYQRYMELFRVREEGVDTSLGVKLTKTTLITPKGQLYFYKKLAKELCEVNADKLNLL